MNETRDTAQKKKRPNKHQISQFQTCRWENSRKCYVRLLPVFPSSCLRRFVVRLLIYLDWGFWPKLAQNSETENEARFRPTAYIQNWQNQNRFWRLCVNEIFLGFSLHFVFSISFDRLSLLPTYLRSFRKFCQQQTTVSLTLYDASSPLIFQFFFHYFFICFVRWHRPAFAMTITSARVPCENIFCYDGTWNYSTREKMLLMEFNLRNWTAKKKFNYKKSNKKNLKSIPKFLGFGNWVG